MNGHLGSTIAGLCVARGDRVRGLVRPTSDRTAIAGLPIELCFGDLRDREAIRRAVHGATVVIHTAAPTVMRGEEDRRAVFEGVDNVFEAVRQTPTVRRAVYVSSSVTVGVSDSPGKTLSEDAHQRLQGTLYQEVKWDAEELATSLIRAHRLPIVVVNPSTIVGPGNVSPTPPSKMIVDFLNYSGTWEWIKKLNTKIAPVYFSTGLSVVDVEDVARGILLAAEKGVPGERYLLAGDNMTFKAFFDALASLTGLPAPWFPVTKPLMLCASAVLSAILDHPPMSYALAKTMVGRYSYYSSAKAVADLGYSWRPSREALRRSVQWFLGSPLVSPERKELIRRLGMLGTPSS